MAISSRLRPRNINQALAWLLVAVMVPLLLGAFALLVAQARQEKQLAQDHLDALAKTLVQAVDRELDYGRGQLEVIAASPGIDAEDWEQLQHFSAEVAGRRFGSHIVLVRPDGQLLLNTAVPWGQPLVNIWTPGDDEDRQVLWQGRPLPLRWQKVSRQVFDGQTVYSDLYFGGTTKSPTLALSVPVTRQGQVRYGLTLVFPPALLEQLIQSSVDTMGMQVLVVDRRGLVVAGNAAAIARLGDRAPPVPGQPQSTAQAHSWAGHYLSTGLDGTPLQGAYAVSRVNGFVVRVALPAAAQFSPGITSTGWVALVLASLAISAILAGLLGRRLAQPLRELARIARHGQPPDRGSASGIAEIDALAHALRIGAEAERQRAREHVLRVVAQHQQTLLTQSEQRLKRVLDQLFVFVSVLDLEGRMLQCNSAPLEQAGITAGDVAGKPFWECHWWLHQGAEAARVREAADRAAHGETVRFDTIARFTEAELLTVDLQLAPLRDDEGRVTHLIASGVDVQSRISAMRRLEQSESDADAARRLLEATLEAAPVGITVADPQGRVLHVNQAGADISGLAGEDNGSETVLSTRDDSCATGTHKASPLTPDQWPLHQALRERLAVSRVVDISSTHQAGPRATVLMSAAPVFDAAGQVIAGVMVQVDITQRVQAESALRRADRQKDEFLATLSHELRNPLGPIRNAAELIRLSRPADERVQRARAIIDRQVSHLSRLVDDLLDVSRITLGTIALRRETLDLGALVTGAVDSVRTAAAAAGLTLEHDICSPEVTVSGDATRLHQCILNLLNNAIKFTPSGGRIGIRVTHDGPAARIEVQDDGNGISPVNLERIFELFAQEHPSGFGGNTGLGIGLALTRRLVQLHGGSVRAHSAGPGHGSTFRMELPALSLAAAPHVDKAAVEDGGGARILVVDDNRDAADLLTEILIMRGYRATSVYCGEAAVLAVKQEVLGAVLLDIGLPDIDGYEVCRRIRQATPSNPPLVIALTGWGQDKDRDRATAAGFSAHLTKPADPDRIIALLKGLAEPGRAGDAAAPLPPFAIPVKTRAAPAAGQISPLTGNSSSVSRRQGELDA